MVMGVLVDEANRRTALRPAQEDQVRSASLKYVAVVMSQKLPNSYRIATELGNMGQISEHSASSSNRQIP